MKKGVIVVDSVWGVGHRKRMALLAEELSKEFAIDFFQTLPDVGIRASSKSVHHHFIPSLFKLTAIGSSNLLGEEEMIEKEKERLAAYQQLLKGEYAFFLYEQYPFGKPQLKYDRILLLAYLKRENPHVKSISSFRGYQWETFPEIRRREIEEALKSEFDLTLFHIDGRYKEELLPSDVPFTGSCFFTGFIADKRLSFSAERERGDIVVTVGGGTQGTEMMQAVYALSKEWQGQPFRFFNGPLSKEPYSFAEPFSEENYRNALERAKLMISLGGYNSLIDHAVSKTPALVFPGAVDQPLLTRFFAKRGSVYQLSVDDLDIKTLKDLALKQMGFRNWSNKLDMEGASRSLELILETIGQSRGP